MNYNKYLNSQEFLENSSKRIPVCIVVDCSGSMKEMDGTSKSRIDRVNDGIKLFYEGIAKNNRAKKSVDVLIIQVGNEATILRDFSSTEKKPPKLKFLHEKNNLIEGINLALNKLEERKKIYRAANIDYYQPWLLIMSDGGVSRELSKISFKAIQKETKRLEESGKLSVFPIYVQGKPVLLPNGTYKPINPDTYNKRRLAMSEFSNNPKRLIDIDLADSKSFEDLFQFLHKSASSVANHKGIIYDEKYGSFKNEINASKDNGGVVELYNYQEAMVDAQHTYVAVTEEFNDESFERSESEKLDKEMKKILEERHTAKIFKEKINVAEAKRKKRIKIDVVVNGKRVFPEKKYIDEKLQILINLNNNDKIVLLNDDSKVIYDEYFHSDGYYKFLIDENNIDVLKISNEKNKLGESCQPKHMNEEIQKIIDKLSKWDRI